MFADKPPFLIQESTESETYLKILIYGVHGAGKTYLAGTSANVSSMRDVLLLSVEGGEKTLKAESPHRFEDIDIIQARSFGQIASLYKYLIAHCDIRDGDESSTERLRELESWVKQKKIDEPRRYRTVIVDSLSEVDQVHKNKLQGIDESTALDVDPGDSSWALYNTNLSKITRFVKLLRDLPIHVILTCAAVYKEDHLNRRRFQPKLTGQLAVDVQGIVDVVGFLEAGNVDEESGKQPRRLWVMPSSTHDAKCRWTSNNKAHFIDPSLKEILSSVGLD